MSGLTETAESPIARGPRFAAAWAFGVYLLAALSLGYPALGGGFLVNHSSDQFIAGFAFRDFAADVLRTTGEFPLWNPYLFGGMPYVAAMHGDIFYPTFLLRMVMETDVAMTWGFIIHLVLAGLFTYLFLRALGLGFLASLVGGLAYMMSGNIAGLVSPGHDGKLFISALLPLALLLVTRGVRDGRPWAWGALAFTIGLAVLTPHPQLLQYLLLVCGAYGLFLAFTDTGAGKLPRQTALRRLGLSASAVIVGFAMGAIQFLPVLQYVDWSPRAGGKGWEGAVQFSMPPEEMVNYYVPQFSGILDRYWGDNGIHLHSEYLGAAVIVLAALAFTRAWALPLRRALWFWAAALVVAQLWALGGYTPFYRLVYAIVPGTKFFRAPSTMLFVVSFCVAVLAAYGAERAMQRRLSRRFLGVGAVIVGLLALVGVAGGLTNLAVSTAVPQNVDFALANDAAIRGGTLRSTLFAALMLAALFLLVTKRLGRDVGGMLLAAIIVVDLWSVERLYWRFSPPAEVIYAPDETITYIKAQDRPGRVATFPVPANQAQTFRDPFLSGDGLMVHGIRQIGGYHGNELGRYQRLAQWTGRFAQSLANPNFWDLANLRYILTDAEDLGVPSMRRVVGPVTNAHGNTVYLFETTEENPAAWVTPVIVTAPDDDVLNTVLNPLFDVRTAALFDTAAGVTGRQIEQLPQPLTIEATVTRFDPGAIDIELDQPAPEGSALVVSENYYPGWTAVVDGQQATIGRADMTLIGVVLPAGAREISLRFDSPPFRTGKTTTLVALAIALVAWGGGALMGIRRRG